jgi:hypothetical protein
VRIDLRAKRSELRLSDDDRKLELQCIPAPA